MAQVVTSPKEWLECLWRDRSNKNPHQATYQLFPGFQTPTACQDGHTVDDKSATKEENSVDIIEEAPVILKEMKKTKRKRKHARSRHGKREEAPNKEEALYTSLDITKQEYKTCVKTNNKGQITSLNLNSLKKNTFFIQSSIFNHLSNLNLFDNNLTEFPSCICNLHRLKDLQLSKNQIKYVPETVGKLNNLVKLSIQSNKISVLPKSICDMEALTELYLSNNDLTSIPGSVGNIKNLTILAIGGNKLFWLPKSIGKLKKIQSINAQNNRIRCIPKSFAKIACLRWLDVTGNNLFENPIFLGKNKTLRVKY